MGVRKLSFFCFLVFAILNPRFSILEAQAAPVTEDAYQRVGNRLMCQCGCGQTVAGCNHYQCSSSDILRKEVRAAIAATPNDERAVELLVQKWGVKLLAEPPKTGFQLTAWVAPFAVLLLGMVVVAAILRHWHRRTLAAAGGAPDPHLLARYEERLNEEIEED